MALSLFGLILLLALMTSFVIGINHVLREFGMSGGLRALVTVFLVFLIPPAIAFGLYFMSFARYVGHVAVPVEDRPATRVEERPAQRLVNLNNPADAQSDKLKDLGAIAAQQRAELLAKQQQRILDEQQIAVRTRLDFMLLIVVALVVVGLVIALQVWLRQQQFSISMKQLLGGALSLLWLLPVAFVLLFVTRFAIDRNVAIQGDFNSFSPVGAAIPVDEEQVTVDSQARSEPRPGEQSPVSVSIPALPPGPVTVIPPSPVAVPVEQPPQSLPSHEGVAAAAETASSVASPQPESPGERTANTPSVSLPDWVTRGYVEKDSKRFYIASSQQFALVADAKSQALLRATSLLQADFQARYPGMFGISVTPQWVQASAIRNQHVETIERRSTTSGTPFSVQRVYLQVEASPEVFEGVRREWTSRAVDARVKGLALVGCFLTAMFAVFAGYLRLDDRTQGAYRGRLRFAAIALIAAAGFLAAKVS